MGRGVGSLPLFPDRFDKGIVGDEEARGYASERAKWRTGGGIDFGIPAYVVSSHVERISFDVH